ncbi:MAG: recombination mediator RecR [Candidatus Marinimicrobia bacterium]|nr:recombination mediator RecR [Candidatus Neomarinimicrobiota bacterium]
MHPEPLEHLVRTLARLPALGRRSAERIAFRLVRDRQGLVNDLISALNDFQQQVARCTRCGAVTVREENPCLLCRDPRRDDSLLCVVEDAADVMLIERAGGFRGRYHVLQGKLSPAEGTGVQDIQAAALYRRVQQEGIREVLLALNTDVESDATAGFLHDALARLNVRVTRLALGIPVGSGLAYADAVTLSRAISGRQDF